MEKEKKEEYKFFLIKEKNSDSEDSGLIVPLGLRVGSVRSLNRSKEYLERVDFRAEPGGNYCVGKNYSLVEIDESEIEDRLNNQREHHESYRERMES